MSLKQDVLIIGAGLAGLTAAWQATNGGRKVRLVAKGWGATHWHTGCIDVLGYYPLDNPLAVDNLSTAVGQLIDDHPHHPYALVGLARLSDALDALKALGEAAGYPLRGSLEKNWLLPSAAGAFRPTCLAPETMVAGDLSHDAPMLIVGFRHLNDFYANVVAANLERQGIPAEHIILDLPALHRRNFTTSTILAGLMEQPVFMAELVGALKGRLGKAARIGFPAVLGMGKAMWVKGELERTLKRPVFEIPGLTPSVPGIRLHQLLKDAIMRQGGRIYDGMEALGAERDGRQITAVLTEAAARRQAHRADQFVLATGGILGGGITTDYQGQIREVIFNLPVTGPARRIDWFRQRFLDNQGHPIYHSGLTVNEQFRPVDDDDDPIYHNLYAAGTTLAHSEVIRERSFDGVALATGYVVGQTVAA